MSAILEHYSRDGVKTLSNWIPNIRDRLSSKSAQYFDKTFILAPKHVKIIPIVDDNASTLTLRHVH